MWLNTEENQVSIVFLAMSNTSDIFFEKTHFVLDSLGFKRLQT